MGEDLCFKADDIELAGVLLRPEGTGPHPIIVLSHGFSAVMAMGLLDHAEGFRAAGLACLVDARWNGMHRWSLRSVYDIIRHGRGRRPRLVHRTPRSLTRASGRTDSWA